MKVRWTEEALADVEEAIDWLAARSPQAAAGLLDDVLETVQRLGRGELEGPETTLAHGEAVRSWPCPPMRVYYVRREGMCWVLRVYDQRRRPIEREGR